MAISRWGRSVEEVLNSEPPKPVEGPSLQEQITQTAHEIEVEQTNAYMADWVKRRLNRVFPGMRVESHRMETHAWYVISVQFYTNNKIYQATYNVRDEDLEVWADSTRKWATYMDKVSDALRNEIRSKLQLDGINELRLDNRGIRVDVSGDGRRQGSSYSTTANFRGLAAATTATTGSAMSLHSNFQAMGRAAANLSRELEQESKVAEIEEREAIESIKRTIAGQAEGE